jgi:hypothetical protein
VRCPLFEIAIEMELQLVGEFAFHLVASEERTNAVAQT